MPTWIGGWEILIVVVIILLIFGGRFLPRLGRSLGNSLLGLRKGLKEGSDEFRDAVKEDEPEAPVAAAKTTKSAKTPVVEAAAKSPESDE